MNFRNVRLLSELIKKIKEKNSQQFTLKYTQQCMQQSLSLLGFIPTEEGYKVE